MTKEDLKLLIIIIESLLEEPTNIEMKYFSKPLDGEISPNQVREMVCKAGDKVYKLKPILRYLEDKLANAIC